MAEIKLVSERAIRQSTIRKYLIRGAVTIGVIGIAVIGVNLYLSTPHTYEVVWEQEVDLSEAGGIKAFGGNVLVYDRNGASCYNASGSQIWSAAYEMNWPVVEKAEDFVVIADKKGRDIVICSTEGMTGLSHTENPITSVDISSNGTVAVVTEDDTSSYIEYYDAKGNKINVEFKSLIQEDGYPIDIALSPSGTELMVSYIAVDSGNIKNSILFYNFNMQEQKDDYMVGLFSHYADKETLIPQVDFINENDAVAFGDNCISFYSLSNLLNPELNQEYDIEKQIQSVLMDDTNVGLVQKNEDGSKELIVYDASGQQKSDILLEDSYDNIFFHHGYVVLTNSVGCKIYHMSGKLYYEKEFSGSLLALEPGENQRKYYALTGNELQYINLK